MVDCVTRLDEARTALHALSTGNQIKSVTMNDGRKNEYFGMTISELNSYISKLEAECGTTTTTSNNSFLRRRSVGFYG